MPTELFTSKATYPNNIVIPPVALRHHAYYRVPEGNRRDHNIVRVSSFASKELSWHERSCIVCLRVRRKLKLALLKRAQPFLYMLSDVTGLAVDCIADLPTDRKSVG